MTETRQIASHTLTAGAEIKFATDSKGYPIRWAIEKVITRHRDGTATVQVVGVGRIRLVVVDSY